MLQELKNNLIKKLCKNTDNLQYEILQYEKENIELKNKVDNLKIQLASALDEIVLNQKRIDSLLRQLREKNGGK